MDQKVFLDAIKSKVYKQDKNASVILFGSRARGDYREDSDWDFLILTSKKIDRQHKNNLIDSLYDIELEFLQPISSLIYEKSEWNTLGVTPLYQNIAEQGIRI